ncbi:MAG: phosphoglycerate kinase [Nanoarchaeota archaeon]
MKTLSNISVKGRRVLLRIDINSPIANGKVLDSPRFKESAKTISYLLKKGAGVAILAHQGRKDGKDFLSLQQHAKILSKYIGKKIRYVDDLFGDLAVDNINKLKSGDAILLANVRNYDDESLPNKKGNRYQYLCKNFDIYVNDAFSASHRKQGSIILPAKYLQSCIGIGFESEIKTIKKFKLKSKNTLYVLGGEKIEDYLSIFNNLKNKKNKVLASGVLANLLLIAKGHNFGYENKWIEEKGYSHLIPKLKLICKKYSGQIILPVDFAIEDYNTRVELDLSDLPVQSKIWDVGHETVRIFKSEINKTKSIFMKGPLGFSEIPHFSYATVEILKEISLLSKRKRIFSLIGGGHLTTTLEKYKIPNNFSYISTSGGALIAYISGEKLPGLEALED